MFKNASDYEQGRARRSVVDDKRNHHGLDNPLSKGPLTLRNELIVRKKELEAKASRLNAQIALAKRRYNFRESGQVNTATLRRWESEKANIGSEVTDIDSRLTVMRADSRLKSNRDTLEFAECFKLMAKELLVDEIYERIITATIHRMAEGEDLSPSAAKFLKVPASHG